MGTYVCFDRHVHIGYETRTNGILSQLGYVDINEQMLNEMSFTVPIASTSSIRIFVGWR